MVDLKLIENELVPVYVTDNGAKIVDGRELHAVLQSKQDFSTWVKKRLNECDAVENKDYSTAPQIYGTGNGGHSTRLEYTILLDTAKEIAMLERNAKGKQVRRYFIRVDEKYKEGKATALTLQQQIQTIAKGTEELYQRVDAVDGKVGQLESRITDLEGTMTLDYGQQRILGNTVNKTVISALGGKESNAYKKIGKKVFAECNHDLKDFFKVNARGNVPRKRYEEAVAYAENWKPCTNTQMLIEQYNAQQRIDM